MVMPGVSVSCDSEKACAIPKSATLTRPPLVSSTFEGLMSRCTMPRAWAASSASRDLLRDARGGGRRQRTALAQHGRQVATGDQLHDDERPGGVRAVVEDADDVGVVELRRGLRLLAEARPGTRGRRRTRRAAA